LLENAYVQQNRSKVERSCKVVLTNISNKTVGPSFILYLQSTVEMAVQWNASTFRFATDSENEEINETTTKKKHSKQKKKFQTAPTSFFRGRFFPERIGGSSFFHRRHCATVTFSPRVGTT
jgi:hypothetical protein